MGAAKRFTQNPGRNAICYYRYSSDAQRDVSIEQQREEAAKYAEAHGLRIIREYADRAISGTRDDRIEYNLMLTNKAYIGVYKWGNHETVDGMPQLVPDELFEKVAARLESNRHTGKGAARLGNTDVPDCRLTGYFVACAAEPCREHRGPARPAQSIIITAASTTESAAAR